MHRFTFVSIIAVSLSALACGPASDEAGGLECGPGTVLNDGQCMPTSASATGGSAGTAGTGGSGGDVGTGGSTGGVGGGPATGGSGGSVATGGAGGNSATGGSGGSGASGGSTATGGFGGGSGSGGSGGSTATGGNGGGGGYLVAVKVWLTSDQLPAVFHHDLPGYGWHEVVCYASPCTITVAAAPGGLYRLNAQLANGWLVRGDIPGGMLSVPTGDYETSVDYTSLPTIAQLASGQVVIPGDTVWYGQERLSGDGNVFGCLGPDSCVIDAR